MMIKRLALAGLIAFTAGGAQAQVASGTYFMEDGGGTMKITKGAFEISTGGAPGVCNIKGALKGSTGRATEEDVCVLSFRAKKDGYEVVIRTEEGCRSYCGAHASLDGMYYRPAPGCDDSGRKAARAKFRVAYDAKDYAKAETIIAGQLSSCAKTLQPIEAAGVRNDLAITLHHLGRKGECLKVLEPLADEVAQKDEEIEGRYTAAQWQTYKSYVKATRANLALCKA